jgi:hypothetical protein
LQSDYFALGRRHLQLGANQFSIQLHNSSVVLDVWAESGEEKAKWLQALSAESLAAAYAEGQMALSPGGAASVAQAALASSTLPHASPVRIAAFVSYYGHIDYYGFLYRRRKLTNRWVRAWVLLVDSEIHYYDSPLDSCDAPAGTLYICTHSGRPFAVSQSSKRAHCLEIRNPARTYYLAAETERDYLGWNNALFQNQKRIADNRAQVAAKQNIAARARLSTVAY